ncbi:MAG: serine/threonine protein kinase [Thermoguttaceae bacterium]|nr:serine/threonine protein kinase [Thermoguttaceae bacterium]
MSNDQETAQFDFSKISPARPEDLTPGMFLGKEKNYRLEKFLGAGGMGEVWLATEIEDGVELRKVVCKIIPALVQREKEAMEKVLKTFHLVQPLNHPNICPIYSLRADPVCGYFFVIAYADGGTLWDWVQQQPDYASGLSVSQVVEVLRPIAQALDYAHEMGVMHRDVKPQNVLFVTRRGRKIPWLIDFGISAQIHSTTTQTLGDSGSSGTPAYMAPEQCQSLMQDGRTDQYSLGVIVYQLLSGRLPFAADTPVELWKEIVYKPVPPLTNVSAQTNNAVQRALAKERKDRFASCVEFMDALEGKESFSLSRWCAETLKKHKWLWLAALLVLLAMVLWILGASEQRAETGGPTPPASYSIHDSNLQLKTINV